MAKRRVVLSAKVTTWQQTANNQTSVERFVFILFQQTDLFHSLDFSPCIHLIKKKDDDYDNNATVQNDFFCRPFALRRRMSARGRWSLGRDYIAG